MTYRFDPEGRRLPIKLDSTSNAEYAPIPLEPRNAHANDLAQEAATANAKRTGLHRREFLISAAGAATTLLAINDANAEAGKRAGYFELARESGLDNAAADDALGKQEFIFDVQGHYVPPSVAAARKAECSTHDYVSRDYMRCLGADDFVKDVFLDADTDMMVLSFVPSRRENEPLTAEEARASHQIVDEREGTHRLLVHGRVIPNQEGDLDARDELAETYGVSAWKTYTQWGPDGKGAQARREVYLHPQWHPVWAAQLRAFALYGYWSCRENVPGCEFPHLPLGLGTESGGGALRPQP